MFPFMKLQGPQTHITESYVSVPPALVVVDGRGAVWTLGFQYYGDRSRGPDRLRTWAELRERGVSRGEFAFNVLRDGRETGEFANRIEYRGGRVAIFGPEGWKHWTGRTFI